MNTSHHLHDAGPRVFISFLTSYVVELHVAEMIRDVRDLGIREMEDLVRPEVLRLG